MNEIFELRRFGALAVKFYRENMKTNLIFIAVMVVITFLCVCKFNPFLIEYTPVPTEAAKFDFLAHCTGMYSQMFWTLLSLFSVMIAVRSFKNVTSRYKAASVLLLPASSFEKYLLVFLHSTVVIFLVHLAVFYGTVPIANSYKYVGIKEAHYTGGGVFGNQLPYVTPEQEVVYPEVGNVFRIMEDKILYKKTIREQNGNIIYDQSRSIASPFLVWNMVIIIFTFMISLFMWGSITFRKRSALLTILSHGLLFLLLGWSTFRIFKDVFGGNRISSYLYGLRFFAQETGVPELPDLSMWWFLLFYIFPVTYFAIIWRKFKDKQV